jgi:hypothetical protein
LRYGAVARGRGLGGGVPSGRQFREHVVLGEVVALVERVCVFDHVCGGVEVGVEGLGAGFPVQHVDLLDDVLDHLPAVYFARVLFEVAVDCMELRQERCTSSDCDAHLYLVRPSGR